MKRILQIGMTADYAGTEAYIMNQYRKLDRSKLTYDFLDIKDDIRQIACYDEIIDNGDRVIKLPFPNRKKEGIIPYFRLAAWLMRNRHNYLGIAMNINIPGTAFPLAVARLLGYKKVIAHAHNSGYGYELSLVRKWFFEMNRRLINWVATDKLACSKEAGEFLFGDKKFLVINNGIDLMRFRFSLNNREDIRSKLGWKDEFIIGHIGRFSYQKNQEFILDLLKKIHKDNHNIRLLMIGDENTDVELARKIKESIKSSYLQNVLKIIKPCASVEKYYSAFDAFILPSRFEGLPFVGVEAQANGLPCFFSSNISPAIKLTDNATFISLDDIDEWKKKILEIADKRLENESLENCRISNYAEEIAAKGYDLDEQVRKVTDLYLS